MSPALGNGDQSSETATGPAGAGAGAGGASQGGLVGSEKQPPASSTPLESAPYVLFHAVSSFALVAGLFIAGVWSASVRQQESTTHSLPGDSEFTQSAFGTKRWCILLCKAGAGLVYLAALVAVLLQANDDSWTVSVHSALGFAFMALVPLVPARRVLKRCCLAMVYKDQQRVTPRTTATTNLTIKLASGTVLVLLFVASVFALPSEMSDSAENLSFACAAFALLLWVLWIAHTTLRKLRRDAEVHESMLCCCATREVHEVRLNRVISFAAVNPKRRAQQSVVAVAGPSVGDDSSLSRVNPMLERRLSAGGSARGSAMAKSRGGSVAK